MALWLRSAVHAVEKSYLKSAGCSFLPAIGMLIKEVSYGFDRINYA